MRLATFFMACAMASGAGAGVVSVTVLDKEGKPVQDAVVVVLPSAKGTPKAALPVAATINQDKMRFVPALTLVPVGAKVTFTNNDPWEHHTRGSAAGLAQFSNTGGGFELRLEGKADGKPAKGVEVTWTRRAPCWAATSTAHARPCIRERLALGTTHHARGSGRV
jgi:plastocyanin